jgi:3-hydroxy-9,10-secoandrosta-1,3,5(10)-triene-9,17-dione monooxygenase reductase component
MLTKANSMEDVPLRPVDPTRFRAAMGLFTTGVTVITTEVNGVFHGMTANSLTSVSLNPCLLLICPRRGSPTGEAIQQRKAFAVNLLAHGQGDVSRRFIGRLDDRFSGLDMQLDEIGLPMLPQSLAHFSCVLHAIYPGGDHDIMLGEVVACEARDGDPLVFYRGGVGRHRLHEHG